MSTVADETRCWPARAGIGLRSPHVAEIIATRPAIPWLEVHAENYMAGGPALGRLLGIRRDYPVSIHGVGLSLGSAEGPDPSHLRRLESLIQQLEPCLVSEHLSWSVFGGVYLNHLLPLPYTEETLDQVSENVTVVQDRLGRQVLIENPSSYLRFRSSIIPEPELLAELVQRTGCGLLFDVNNLYVNSRNFDFDPDPYLDALPAAHVGEIHLAGHAVNDADGREILIDDHGSRVAEPVWRLYARALERLGPVPTLVEWDTDVPVLDVLLDEAHTADRLLGTATDGGWHARAA